MHESDYAREVKELVSEIKRYSTAQCDATALQVKVKGKLLQLLNEVEHCTNKEALLELDKGLSAKHFLFESM